MFCVQVNDALRRFSACFGLLLDHTQDPGTAVINPMFLFNEAVPLGFWAVLQLEK